MGSKSLDIVIFGAGIAGLWAFHHFKKMGYDVLLLESDRIGGRQSIAAQGIIHSGLKYALAGKVNPLARAISAMPDLWRKALGGNGPVDLSAAKINAESQYLLLPKGLMGGLLNLATKQALGRKTHEVPFGDWPDALKKSGFSGKALFMDEPVLDIPSVIRALAEPYKNAIRLIDTPDDPFGFLKKHGITAKYFIFTAAASNAAIAAKEQHDQNLQIQTRPLLMGLLKPAPFELYAHLIGASEKPVASITTHKDADGALVWYIGGAVAEKPKEADPQSVYSETLKALKTYLPKLDLKDLTWTTLGIDRVEGQSGTAGWLPDTPTIHSHGNVHYCWPTKLTFAPLLTEKLLEKIEGEPSQQQSDWSFLPPVDYAIAPWDKAQWKKAA